ncbi:helix-turn-helix transcriptional regulator [Mycolicibacterium thermoresistibile]
MADPQDRALGAVIRARRVGRGLQQQEMAEMLGLAPVVYGRIELGNRPVKATELRDIARILGVSTDDLLREITPVTPEQQVERAAARRDTAVTSLVAYGNAVVDAVAAVQESDHGALLGDAQLEDADDLTTWLRDSAPSFEGITVPAPLTPVIRQVLDDTAALIPIYPSKGNPDG